LAAPFNLFVNDAFGTAHRANASAEDVAKFLTKKLEYFDGSIQNSEKPMAAIFGGSEFSSDIVLNALVDNKIIIGGSMLFTFLKEGPQRRTFLVEDDFVNTAIVFAKAEATGTSILLLA